MRYFLVFIAFALLAFHEPSLAEAQRFRPAAKKAANGQRVRPGAKVRQKARTTALKKIRLEFSRTRRVNELGGLVSLRRSVREKNRIARERLRANDLAGAATEAGRSSLRNTKGQFVAGAKKLSVRERFAVWRTTRAVKNAALKGAEKRSKLGSIEGTADAVNALAILESKGKLGVVGRWQKARATKRAFSNIRKNASRALKAGELEAAGQNFAFAAELRPGTRQTKSMAKNLVKESFQMAAAYAKAGDSQLTWNVLEMAAAIAQEGGAKFSNKNAQKLMNKAFANALPVLTKSAESAFKSGEVDQAMGMLAEARMIRSTGTAKASRRVAKRQDRLAKKLGPRFQEFEAAQAAAQQQQADVAVD